jgi:hypothetical protein
MSIAYPAPRAVDLLATAVDRVRGDLDRQLPVKTRLRNFWAAACAAQHLGASDVVRQEFFQLASATGLIRDLGWSGKQDIQHVLSWALRRLNPFD